ncbi:high-affinity methionine permease [Athelia psychrophila]|uniref:High-affinity methionine permease n=1 Tax=Athelia psychrophila TaxID=1759441 RepID=A0A166PPH5_9AGAM|nr:high-affinity methionine permease [Fibularhizoctonia sp. CBS 109695]
MSKFLSFRRNARPPSADNQVQSDDNLSASGLTDIKHINAHALDETSTLENEGGAAVEIISPLGRNLGWTSAFFINVNQIIGTGIFATPATIFKALGSVGLTFIYWIIGIVVTLAGVAVYMELTSLFPNRAGAEVVYLEQAFKKPRYLLPASFAAYIILLSYNTSNLLVFAEYVLYAHGVDTPGRWQLRGIGIGLYTVLTIIIALSTKWSVRLGNVLGSLKSILLIFIIITGFAVLGGHTKVADPHAAFRNPMQGTTTGGNGLATALVSIIFSFGGSTNSFNLAPEIKDPIKTLKTSAPAATLFTGIMYILCNVAYFSAVPLDTFRTSGQLIAAVFFESVYGEFAGRTVLPVFVALSSLGNILSVMIGETRIIREIARQGVLPYPKFFSSTKPFGTPAAPLIITYVTTLIVTLAPPPGDAFNFLVDLNSYPKAVFALATVAAVYILRRRNKVEGRPKAPYRAWHLALVIAILQNVFVLAMPWWPPKTGRDGGDVSFWYATYCVVGIGILVLCVVYWYIWTHLLPNWRGYHLEERTFVLDDGAVTKTLVKIWHGRDDLKQEVEGGDSHDEKQSQEDGDI